MKDRATLCAEKRTEGDRGQKGTRGVHRERNEGKRGPVAPYSPYIVVDHPSPVRHWKSRRHASPKLSKFRLSCYVLEDYYTKQRADNE